MAPSRRSVNSKNGCKEALGAGWIVSVLLSTRPRRVLTNHESGGEGLGSPFIQLILLWLRRRQHPIKSCPVRVEIRPRRSGSRGGYNSIGHPGRRAERWC